MNSRYFLLVLINRIYFIIAISLITAVIFFFYNEKFNYNSKLYISTVVIKKPLNQRFDVYNSFLEGTNFPNQKKSSEEIFSDFKTYLNSKDNFSIFLDNIIFRKSLNEDDILILKKHRNSLFEIVQLNKNNLNQYSLKYPDDFKSGPVLLNEYILFASDVAIDDFIKNLKFNLEFKIDQLEKQNQIVSDVILFRELEKLKSLLKNLDKNKFEYNPILDKAIIQGAVDTKNYFFIGLFFGFFFSIVIIFFRQIVIK